jgi:hypothetical protein
VWKLTAAGRPVLLRAWVKARPNTVPIIASPGPLTGVRVVYGLVDGRIGAATRPSSFLCGLPRSGPGAIAPKRLVVLLRVN